MRKHLVAGNWKLNGSLAETETLIGGILGGMAEVTASVAVCPPFPYLARAQSLLVGSNVGLGAQNVCDEDKGAFTGEVSAAMLAEFGCRYAIVGHSERRSLYGESDEMVARRFMGALRGGLVPILCVGESLAEREAGVTEAVVARQMDAVTALAGIGAYRAAVIAYEPVWAIGTGKTASPEQAEDVHRFIRERLAQQDAEIAAQVQILYGGSVKPDNAAVLFSQPNIDGGLIGGAALKAEDFLAICRAA
ncbi:MAG: triose-phosphate isomerase [Thiotrichales bacterium]